MGHQRCPRLTGPPDSPRGVAGPEGQVCRAHTPGSSPQYAYRLSVTNSGRTERPLGRGGYAASGYQWGLWKEEGTLWFRKCLLVMVLVCYNVGIAPKWAYVFIGRTLPQPRSIQTPRSFPPAFLSRLLPEPPAPQQSDRHFRDHRAAVSALPRSPAPYLSLTSWIFCSGLCFCWNCCSCR